MTQLLDFSKAVGYSDVLSLGLSGLRIRMLLGIPTVGILTLVVLDQSGPISIQNRLLVR